MDPVANDNQSALPIWDGTLSASTNSDLDNQIERLRKCECLQESEVRDLCLRAREILSEESNVQRVDAPVTVSFSYAEQLLNVRMRI
jgi:hypothetical protein